MRNDQIFLSIYSFIHKMVGFLTVGDLGKRSEEICASGNGVDGRVLLLVRLFDEHVAVLPAATLHSQSPVLVRERYGSGQRAAYCQHGLAGISPLRLYSFDSFEQNNVPNWKRQTL